MTTASRVNVLPTVDRFRGRIEPQAIRQRSFSPLLAAHPNQLNPRSPQSIDLNPDVTSMRQLDTSRTPGITHRMEQQPLAVHDRVVVDPVEARDAAEKLVASALLMPFLEEMDQSAFRPKEGPFARSLGEKRFGPLLHQHLADRIVKSRSFGLVDAVVERMSAGRVDVHA